MSRTLILLSVFAILQQNYVNGTPYGSSNTKSHVDSNTDAISTSDKGLGSLSGGGRGSRENFIGGNSRSHGLGSGGARSSGESFVGGTVRNHRLGEFAGARSSGESFVGETARNHGLRGSAGTSTGRSHGLGSGGGRGSSSGLGTDGSFTADFDGHNRGVGSETTSGRGGNKKHGY